MTNKQKFALALVTAHDIRTARKLAVAVLKARLAACANLVPRIESHYWWQGKLEAASEVLLLFKTTTVRLKALEKVIIENHPYDTPEFLVLTIAGGNHQYLEWLKAAAP